MTDFDRRKNDAYQAARQGAVQFAGQEQQSRFGMGMGARQQSYGEQLQQHQLPYQTMGQLMGQQAGFTPMQGVSLPGLDVTGTALGYANLANQRAIAQLQANTAMHNAALGHAGGGGGPDPFALMNLEHQHKMEQIAAQQGGAKRPSGPSFGEQIVGGLLPGLGAGIGGALFG